jgi:hypothetical protein
MAACVKIVGDRIFIQAAYHKVVLDEEGNVVAEILTSPSTVTARLLGPGDLVSASVTMNEQSAGVFEGSYVLDDDGLWRGTVVASGVIDKVDNFQLRVNKQKVPA